MTTLGTVETTLVALHKGAGAAGLIGTTLAEHLADRPEVPDIHVDRKPRSLEAAPISSPTPSPRYGQAPPRALDSRPTGAETFSGAGPVSQEASAPSEVRHVPRATLPLPSDGRLGSVFAADAERPPTPRAARSPVRFGRGWVLVIALSSTAGLAALAVADEASRRGSSYGPTSVLFWLGLLLIFVPIALRALARDIDRQERLALVVMLGVALYLAKLLASPHAFTFSDEYTHLRSTQDILRTEHLFAFNPLLPTASYYPGLPALTAGLVDLTGLSTFAAGVMIIGVARALFSACFYLVAERVTGSGRGAAAASLIYATNPMFLFWGASFSYENLALPLAAFVVWWIAGTRGRGGLASTAVAVVGVIVVTITHHIAGFALSVLLAGWWLVERVGSRSSRTARRQLGFVALLAGSATLAWFFAVADPASSYLLSNNLVPALRDTGSLLLGHTPPRKLYASGGYTSHAWEVVAGFTAIAVLLLALPVALRRAFRSRHRAPVVLAMIVAIAFPLSLLPRLAPVGVAISGRSSEYVYAALGCIIGLLLVEAASSRGTRLHSPPLTSPRAPRTVIGRHKTILAAVLLTVVFVGNVTIGTAFYQRLPEATHPTGYPSFVQPDVVAASKWARAHLGINQPFGASAIDSYALATYGGQDTLDQNRIWPVFFAESMDGWIVEMIKAEGVRYVLVDWRMTRGVPQTPGYYFSPFEWGAGEYRRAFPAAGLEKFSITPCVRSIYGAGAVEIFDLSQIESGACRPLREAPAPAGGQTS